MDSTPLETLDLRDKRYVSLIPAGSVERVTWQSDDFQSREVEYLIDGKVIGSRRWDIVGQLNHECYHIDGSVHERCWDWYEEGHLTFAESLLNGVPHGFSMQFFHNGKVLGTFTMEHGTGIDLWWHEQKDGTRLLSEAKYFKSGSKHGFEWWINDDQRTVYIERHWQKGELHGIEREWKSDGGVLDAGFPKFFLSGRQVQLPEYLDAVSKDPSLPPFSERDNDSNRIFPQEILENMPRNS